MEKNLLTLAQTTPKIQLIQKFTTSNYKLIIPEDVENKIRFACSKSWDTEWSGTLFFTKEGTFEDNNLTIKCVDIFIMDVGNAVYTEFDMSPDVITYMTENPELLDCQLGLIHSHGNMKTFFSTTDKDTLREEGYDRNNFVSLIVNNEGTYSAAITRKIKSTKIIKECYSYEFFGDGKKEGCSDYEESSEIIEWYNLKVTKECKNIDALKEMSKRFKEVIENKKNKQNQQLIKMQNITSHHDDYSMQIPFKEYEKTNSSLEFNDWYNRWANIDETNGIHINGKLKDKVIKQMLTCNMCVPKSFNIKNWIENEMVKTLDATFTNFAEFEDFASYMCEITLFYTKDEDLESIVSDISEFDDIMATDLINELKTFKSNKYIEYYIKELNKYCTYA